MKGKADAKLTRSAGMLSIGDRFFLTSGRFYRIKNKIVASLRLRDLNHRNERSQSSETGDLNTPVPVISLSGICNAFPHYSAADKYVRKERCVKRVHTSAAYFSRGITGSLLDVCQSGNTFINFITVDWIVSLIVFYCSRACLGLECCFNIGFAFCWSTFMKEKIQKGMEFGTPRETRSVL